MSGYVLSANGELKDAQGNPIKQTEIPDTHVIVPHLKSHVTSYQLPGGDIVKVRIIYTSHCWSRAYSHIDSTQHVLFMDGNRPRSFCPERYQLSLNLKDLIEGLPTNKIYMTRAERNFGTYSGTKILSDGTAYTAYFTLKADKGKFDGVRHTLALYVESAYLSSQLGQVGQKQGLPL